jgi:DNA-binding transcriptional ArsR family regulator
MAHYDPHFPDILKIAWDTMFKKHDRLILVLCGSVSSWIKDNIIDNGAFVGRRSLDVVVDELPLGECVKFWGRQTERLAPREIIDVLSVTGGVPRYLEEIDPALDANANIAKLCFSPHGILRDDFDDMFNDVITKLPAMCGRVLRSLVDGAKTVSDISEALGIARGGSVSETLDILSEAGLVRRDAGRNPETSDLVRQPRYRLKDNYSRFYLKYIEPVKDMIDDGSYDFTSMSAMPGWDAVLGLAFENLVVNNYRELLPRLHLGRTLITSAAPYVRRKSKERDGCQVDLLIQSRRSLYFVEIKRKAEIGREVIEQVDSSVRSISRPEGVSAHTALVYDGHLSPIVEADGYFDAIVSFREVLGL